MASLMVAMTVEAGSARISGVIIETSDTTLPVQAGDPFSVHIVYNSHTREVTRTIINIGLLRFSYPREGTFFTFSNDPCDLYVVYQVSQSRPSHFTLLLFGWTYNSCVFPPLPEFIINDFTFFLNGQTTGQLTGIPEVHP